MRDILLTLIVLGALLYTLKRPYVGVLLMSWLGYMNPHRLTYGFAYSMPFVAITAGITALMLLFTKERSAPPNIAPIWFWVFFIVWVSVSTPLALYPESTGEYSRFIKIQLGILFTIVLIRTPHQIQIMTAVIAFSIGFYGIKGGLFTIATGGSYRVWGPTGSFIEGNNEIALALLMVIPLIYFFYLQFKDKRIKAGMLICMLLCIASAIGSQSRGALLALICSSLFLWWHSPQKKILAAIALLLIVGAIPFLPDTWFERMETIQTYDTDASALGRINSWYMAINIASQHLFGGGLGVFSKAQSFMLYAPNPEIRVDAHSIYFEILGEQGFIGLCLFLLMWISTWLCARKITKKAALNPQCTWAANLAKMIKVSLVAYASGGAFLGLAYWDLPYHLLALAAVTYRWIEQHETSQSSNPRTLKSDRAL